MVLLITLLNVARCTTDAAHLALAPGLVGEKQQVRPSRLPLLIFNLPDAVAKTVFLHVNCPALHTIWSDHTKLSPGAFI